MLTAVEHLGAVGVGVTRPQFFRADDGKKYVVKLQNNRLGCKVLVSEWLGAEFGNIMKLCFPASDIIQIDEEVVQNSPALLTLGVTPGQHFASHYLEDTEYVNQHNINKAVNITAMAGILLFDHLFHNPDRTKNKKNLILHPEKEGSKIYAIDNSHLFRSGKWTLASLATLATKIEFYYPSSYGSFLKEALSPQDFLPYAERIAQLSNEQIATIIKNIPAQWLPDQPEQQELAYYIQTRRDMVDEIRKILCKELRRPHGERRWLFGKVIKSFTSL